MKIAIIGGTGHIGSYLTPLLVDSGYAVTCVCRGQREPYRSHPAWASAAFLHLDRAAEEQAGTFGERIAAIGAEVVIDLTCYYPASAEQLVHALRGRIAHLLHCGTIWVHGHSAVVPTTEEQPRRPFGDYGVRKAAIESWLLAQSAENGFPVTLLHPGHLVGPGWAPINPAGNFNPAVFSALLHRGEIRIPHLGMETVHHVHAADVAQAFLLAIQHRDAALGQSFHVVSPAAITLRGYAEHMASFFHQPAELRFLPWAEWKEGMTPRDIAVTEDHLRHSPHCSIRKAQTLLGYQPRYTSFAAVEESVDWLVRNGVIA
jgi:nucleoside-diphosphate-sugar epimerase